MTSSYRLTYGPADSITLLLLCIAVVFLAAAGVLVYLVHITSTELDPHGIRMRACLHASTSAAPGTQEFSDTLLACESKVSARDQAERVP